MEIWLPPPKPSAAPGCLLTSLGPSSPPGLHLFDAVRYFLIAPDICAHYLICRAITCTIFTVCPPQTTETMALPALATSLPCSCPHGPHNLPPNLHGSTTLSLPPYHAYHGNLAWPILAFSTSPGPTSLPTSLPPNLSLSQPPYPLPCQPPYQTTSWHNLSSKLARFRLT
jgi:hypothetical protein